MPLVARYYSFLSSMLQRCDHHVGSLTVQRWSRHSAQALKKLEASLQEDGQLARTQKVILHPYRSHVLFMIAGNLSELGQLYSISLADFERDILPNLREHDSVIWFDCRGDSAASKSDEIQQLHVLVEK